MFKKKHLELIEDRQQMNKVIEDFIRNKAYKKEAMHILEAGCGRNWPFQLEGINYILTGVDMDKAALDIRKNVLSDLHESIEGDLCLLDLGVDRFDVIYCSYVLEHIENADVVLNNFVKWIKPNGIIIIKVPDPDSVHGYITRITPHWFHVFFIASFRKRKMLENPVILLTRLITILLFLEKVCACSVITLMLCLTQNMGVAFSDQAREL